MLRHRLDVIDEEVVDRGTGDRGPEQILLRLLAQLNAGSEVHLHAHIGQLTCLLCEDFKKLQALKTNLSAQLHGEGSR